MYTNELTGEVVEKMIKIPKIAKITTGGTNHQALFFHKYSKTSFNMFTY